MAAAVADFRPKTISTEKIKRGVDDLTITLEPTDDILKALAALRRKGLNPAIVVGFAAESQNLLENARKKLQAKKLDLLVANDISATDAGFNVDTNRVSLLYPDGRVEQQPLIEKSVVAELIVEKIAEMLI
jgi:phosphopantothenoylcysteine decarboxylase/phosphopantothenate--cysteine ligase